PMAYEYYPSATNFYNCAIPDALNGRFVTPTPTEISGIVRDVVAEELKKWQPQRSTGVTEGAAGKITGVKGACAGYVYDIKSGEQFVIGKDAKQSQIVIDPAYKEVSRRHCSIRFDGMRGVYVVTDYSSNGTKANGNRLTPGQATDLHAGTQLELANGKNIFRLG
ncbi:MAG: FHA domain-containing protein, partial [Clostridia bacterium]|nr:FHA domain-containing protein [Clostridia bacterium]